MHAFKARRRLLAASLLLIGGLSVAVATAADDKSDGFTSVFDGKTLDGWVVTGCKAGVEEGSLVIQEGLGFVRLDKQYGDFVLDLEWKNRKADKYDSGIYFRAGESRGKNPWPDKYQINLQNGQEGNVVGSRTAKSTGLAKPGEWNRFKLTVVGTTAELEINGKPAWKMENVSPESGYIGIQCEVPNGGQYEFRNIKVKALTPPTAAPAGATTQPATAPGGSSADK